MSISSRLRLAGVSIPISASCRTQRAALELFLAVAQEWRKAGRLRERQAWPAGVMIASARCCGRSDFDDVPIKPQRVYHEMNRRSGATPVMSA